uniref:Uncharacterized protein n=1 Tax=Anopheles albimanus TaxID=7167 RepID=A0A182FXI9_ANOAL
KQTFITSANLYSLSVNQQKRSTEESSQNPLKYFGSQASRWTARNSRSGPKRDIPWFQPYVKKMTSIRTLADLFLSMYLD